MVEIYNESIHDLLSSKLTSLDIRAQGTKVTLPGMTELPVGSAGDIDEIIGLGEKNRRVASTKMNSQRYGPPVSSGINTAKHCHIWTPTDRKTGPLQRMKHELLRSMFLMSVSLVTVSLSVTRLRCAKAAERIEVLLRVKTL